MIKKIFIALALVIISRSALAAHNDITLGSNNAPIEVKVYYSITCPACGKLQSDVLSKIEEEYIKTNQAKIKYIAYPLDNLSLLAETYLACIPSISKHKQALRELLLTQRSWVYETNKVESLKNILRKHTSEQVLTKCEVDENSYNRLAERLKVQKLKGLVKRTPTVFINGNPISVPTYIHIKNKIDAILNK